MKEIYLINEIDKYLKESKTSYFFKDNLGNFNIISCTDKIILPTEEILDNRDKKVDYWKRVFDGVFDIHKYLIDNNNYYSVGCKKNVMYGNIKNATHLYKINTYNSENLIDELVETMSVDFVKYGEYTVLPYPVKYLREYIKILKDKKQNVC